MILHLASLLILQTSPMQYGAGIAVAPGGQLGPVLRVAKEWSLSRMVGFRLEGAFATAGAAGTHTECTFTQCFHSDFELRARELEMPALWRLSVTPNGPLFLIGGPVFAVRLACNGTVGSETSSCPNGSDLSWGGALGGGLRLPLGPRMMTLEARLQYFGMPLVRLNITDSGQAKDYRASAVIVAVALGGR